VPAWRWVRGLATGPGSASVAGTHGKAAAKPNSPSEWPIRLPERGEPGHSQHELPSAPSKSYKPSARRAPDRTQADTKHETSSRPP
jgi:hypothetical protein